MTLGDGRRYVDHPTDGRESIVTDPLDAWNLAKSNPEESLHVADAVLRSSATARSTTALALAARGRAHFELGQNDRAIGDLREAAAAVPDHFRPRVVIALAVAVAASGGHDEATALLGDVIDATTGHAEDDADGRAIRGLALSQLGYLMMHAGDLRSATGVFQEAIELLDGDPAEEDALARVHGNLGYSLLLAGDLSRAVESFEAAIAHGHATNQMMLVAGCLQNQAYAQSQQGEFPAALHQLGEARQVYSTTGDPRRNLSTLFDDFAETYRLAGLTGDAVDHATRALDLIAGGGNLEQEADATYRLAVCLLDHGDHERAEAVAERASPMFRQAGRSLWATRATLVALEATAELTGEPERVGRAEEAIDELDRAGWRTEALRIRNRLLVAALASGDAGLIDRLLTDDLPETDQSVTAKLERVLHRAIAARHRRGRADGPLGEARDVLLSHRRRLADPELRAGSGRLAEAFRFVSLDQALGTRDPAEVLSAEEHWRAASVRLPRARPSTDPDVAALSQELRSATRLAAEADEPDPALAATIHRLEERLRRISHRSTTSPDVVPTADGAAVDDVDPKELRSRLAQQLGRRRLTEWFGHRGQLLAVDIDRTGAELRTVGPLPEVRARASRLRRDLARLLQAPPGVDLTPRWSRLTGRAQSLGQQLLGSESAADGLVLCPPGQLQELPWRLLLPAEAGQATIAFSATAWLGAEATIAGPELHVIAGPDLAAAADDHRSTTTPVGSVTAAAAAGRRDLDLALDEADLLHIAAHGRFRADNPMFSSVRLHDGEFALHELSAYDRVPSVVALAACDAGRSLHLEQGAEQLGPASAWIDAGVETVIAPICAVPDGSTATVFQAFYDALPGSTPAEALAAAWHDVAGAEPTLAGTAAAFLCFGRGGPRLGGPAPS